MDLTISHYCSVYEKKKFTS